MATYLELVNKVIQESASEADDLTSSTWSSAEAGRRIYPRIKRNVADAWKAIQMKRDEWEFMTAELSTLVYPRFKVVSGMRAAGEPSVGSVFVGADSGLTLTVRTVTTDAGSWTLGTARGTIEFSTTETTVAPILNETFTEVTPVLDDGEFLFVGRGTYDFQDVNADIREIQWETFTANVSGADPARISFVPFDAWIYDNGFQVSESGPMYVSQDYDGKVLFYPQTLDSFRVKFTYEATPQILSAYTDEPTRLPSEYHDWIVWEALMIYALFDKNSSLYAYAQKQAMPFMLKAERRLMPMLQYTPSPFNRG